MGNQKAYAALMDLHWNMVYDFLLVKTGDEATADDLTIEVFGKAFKNLHQYSPDFAFGAWISKIASNHFIDHYRKTRNKTFPLSGTVAANDESLDCVPCLACEDPDPEENFIRKQKVLLMHETVKRLKPHYRKLIELRYFKEYSYQEIAAEIDMPMGTIKVQLYRAKELLYSILKHSREKI
jgi:RNA polymerase sigma factor (sigma-70 family)